MAAKPFNILYNQDLITDEIHLLVHLNEFAAEFGVTQLSIRSEKLAGILQASRADFPHVGGLEGSNPFKKAAHFACYFIGEAPLVFPFPTAIIGEDLAKIANHQNAMAALQVCIDSLEGAAVHCSNGNVNTLANRIALSRHSYVDIVDALSHATPSTHFQLVAVLLEQLCYKTNPDCQYPLLAL